MEFKSLGDLALHFAALPTIHTHELQKGLERCAVRIEKTAKDEIGQYQAAVGPFPAWAELATQPSRKKPGSATLPIRRSSVHAQWPMRSRTRSTALRL